MGAWTTSIDDLRGLLSDGPQDKRAFQKQVVGAKDGSNMLFRNLENRYAAGTLIVYVNGKALTEDTDYTESDPVAGEFTFLNPYPANATIKASYYFQYFIDSELTTFLSNASRKLGFSSDQTSIDDGLIPSCLHFAAADAFKKLVVRWTELLSSQFLTEDAPMKDETIQKAELFMKLSEDYTKEAALLRDEYYQRQGRQYAPSFSIYRGHVRETQPER